MSQTCPTCGNVVGCLEAMRWPLGGFGSIEVDALNRRIKKLERVLEAARAAVGWDWSDNDDDCVADINRLCDAVKATDA